MSETLIVKKILLALSSSGTMAFRNNTGAYKSAAGHFIKYGVGGAGGSDILGLTPITITQEMIGKRVAVFTAIEAKTKTGKATEQQKNFISAIKKQGGIAGVARSEDDALEIIKGYINDIKMG